MCQKLGEVEQRHGFGGDRKMRRVKNIYHLFDTWEVVGDI